MSQLKAIVDKLLTNVSAGYFPQGYIAEGLLPQLPVKEMSGLIGKYGKNHIRVEHSFMGGRGEALRVEPISRSSATYLLEKHGLEGLVTPEDYANVELPYDAEQDEVLGLTSILLTVKERALAAALTDTAVLTQNATLSGSDQWSDYNNSSPISDIKTMQQEVYDGSGMVANTLIIPWDVSNSLSYHPQILDQLGYKYNSAGPMTAEQWKGLFKVDRVLVPSAKYNSAVEGQSDSLASCWGKHCVLAYIPPSAAKYQESLGYAVVKAGEAPRKVYKSPVVNPPGSMSIIVQDYYDFVITNAGCASLRKSVIA